MKSKIGSLLLLILTCVSLAIASWNGDTLVPPKDGDCFLISRPEEYVWLGGHHLQSGEKAKLVADIVFGKDKDSVDYNHPIKSLSSPYLDLDFNGYSVYSAYSMGRPFILGEASSNTRTHVKNVSFRNFKIAVDLSASKWDTVSAINLKEGVATGVVLLDGIIQAYGKSDSVTIMGGGFRDGILENWTSIILEGEVGEINVYGVGNYGLFGIDSSVVREAVNYGDINVVTKKAGNINVHGLVDFPLNKSFYKLSNYGDISVEGYYASVSGLSNELKLSERVAPEVYNEGNISVKLHALDREFSIGGLFIKSKGDSLHFAKALNIGNIYYEDDDCYGYVDYDIYAYVGGCVADGISLDNLTNEGDLDIRLCALGYDYAVMVGGVVASGTNLSNVVNKGNIKVSVQADSGGNAFVGGIVGDHYGYLKYALNMGNVEGVNSAILGGIAGFGMDDEISMVMNFGNVSEKSNCFNANVGGIVGMLMNLCDGNIFECNQNEFVMKNNANYGSVYEFSACDEWDELERVYDDHVGGLSGSVRTEGVADVYFQNSFNVGSVKKILAEDSVALMDPFAGKAYKQCYYDWNVFYESETAPKNRLYPSDAKTTAYMQSEEFIYVLNNGAGDTNLWTHNESYPYPIIAGLEKWMDVSHQKEGKPAIPSSISRLALPSFKVSADGLNILVSGAHPKTPYALFNLLGKSMSRGRISSQNQKIPVASAGTYIIKVGKTSRTIVVK